MAYLAEDNHWSTNSWVSVPLWFPDISNQPEDKEMIPLPPGMPAPYMPLGHPCWIWAKNCLP